MDINNNKINILLLCSPSFYPIVSHPYLSLPLLSGQLKRAGYNTCCKDLSLEFFNDLFSYDLLDESLNKIYENFDKYTPEFYEKVKNSNEYSDFELKSIKHKTEKFLRYKNNNIIEKLYNNIKKHIDNNSFINNEKLYKNALFFHTLPYIYDKSYSSNNYDFISTFAFDKNNNFFIDYLSKKILTLPQNPNLIMISKSPDFQIYHFFTLCGLLKKHYINAKIVMGGSWFPFIKDSLFNYPDIFDKFCDFALVGNGENSVVELAEYVSGLRDKKTVSNLLYKNENGIVIQNEEFTNVNLNKLAYADYDDFDFSKYQSEKRTVSMNFSKGCYWGKCNFCSFSHNVKLKLKTVSYVIDEIKYYIDKYKIENIYLVDDSIMPAYYSKFADAILENNIKVNIESFAMMDKGFTYDLFVKMRKAGVFSLVFGMDTHSEKVYRIANKGGDFEYHSQIIKDAHNAGIYTQLNVIEGLPGENFEDLLQTVKFLNDNVDYIDKYMISRFYIPTVCGFADNPDLYGLTLLPKEDFSDRYLYKKDNSDINISNSFYYFEEKYYDKNIERFEKNNIQPCSKEVLREVCHEYLKLYSPYLL